MAEIIDGVNIDGVEYQFSGGTKYIEERNNKTSEDNVRFFDDNDELVSEVNRDGVFAKGFFDLQGNPIGSSVGKWINQMSASNTNCPIVVFIYDDNFSQDAMLVEMLEARNMFATFSTIGDVRSGYLTPENELGQRLQAWVRRGHGIVGHGLTRGGGYVSPGNGLNTMTDSDCYKAIGANNRFLDYFGLPHKGLAYFNTWEYNPHTISIVGKYYDYGFELGAGYNSPSIDLYKLSRYSTDGRTMLAGAKALVDRAIGRNCIIAFGGHMSRTGTGTGSDSYSTMTDFTELLDYIGEKVANHQILAMNSDDAVALFTARNNALGGVKAEARYTPSKGDLIISNSNMSVCITEGVNAVYDIIISGTPSEGVIKISNVSTNLVDSSNSYETLNYMQVSLTTQSTIEDVIKAFKKVVCRDYTIIAKDSVTIRLYADSSGVRSTPAVIENTTGLNLAITQVRAGVNATWSN